MPENRGPPPPPPQAAAGIRSGTVGAPVPRGNFPNAVIAGRSPCPVDQRGRPGDRPRRARRSGRGVCCGGRLLFVFRPEHSSHAAALGLGPERARDKGWDFILTTVIHLGGPSRCNIITLPDRGAIGGCESAASIAGIFFQLNVPAGCGPCRRLP